MARPIRLLIPFAVLIALSSAPAQTSQPSPTAPASEENREKETPEPPAPTPTPAPAATPTPTPTPTPTATPTPTPTPTPKKAAPPFSEKPAKKDHSTKASSTFFENLSPEEAKQFQENLKRWKSLPRDLQKDLRRNEEFRRQRILKEINDAITQSGLKLDEEQRQLFTFKFAQERRTIEENLRRAMERDRRTAVDRLIKELVVEFQAMPHGKREAHAKSAAPTPAKPESTPSPKPASTPAPAPAPTSTPSPAPTPVEGGKAPDNHAGNAVL